MRAVGWHNGSALNEPSGYGLKFAEADRDRSFDRAWSDVIVELEGDGLATITLSPSFWRSCTELRSADVGRWLLDQRAAPWPQGKPPGVAVNHVEENRFTARVIRSRSLL
ncbi:MAG: hypothetical protein LC808_39360 [Actinobacteria bacterium]|nr:hypothetical protein [Actinomycetota bacterium]